jgi:hypothetical protein
VNGQDWTPAPWRTERDSYSVDRIWAAKDGSEFDVACTQGDGSLNREEEQANAHRIVAAVNATRHFTTEALDGIVADGKELELALLASANLIVLDKAQREAKAGFEAGRRGLKGVTNG